MKTLKYSVYTLAGLMMAMNLACSDNALIRGNKPAAKASPSAKKTPSQSCDEACQEKKVLAKMVADLKALQQIPEGMDQCSKENLDQLGKSETVKMGASAAMKIPYEQHIYNRDSSNVKVQDAANSIVQNMSKSSNENCKLSLIARIAYHAEANLTGQPYTDLDGQMNAPYPGQENVKMWMDRSTIIIATFTPVFQDALKRVNSNIEGKTYRTLIAERQELLGDIEKGLVEANNVKSEALNLTGCKPFDSDKDIEGCDSERPAMVQAYLSIVSAIESTNTDLNSGKFDVVGPHNSETGTKGADPEIATKVEGLRAIKQKLAGIKIAFDAAKVAENFNNNGEHDQTP